jgi:hypothetical protein
VTGSTWRQLCGGSLLLAAIGGFGFGWKHRAENPPFIHGIKTKEPPEVGLLKRGHYDEAVNAALSSALYPDEYKYRDVAGIYFYRAMKEPLNREKWIKQSVFYIEKGISAVPDDPLNSAEAAAALLRIGNSSDQACPYFRTALTYAQNSMSQLKGDSILLGDEKMPNQPIRDRVANLQNKIQGTIAAKCSSTP